MMTTLSVCAAAHTCSQPVDSGESRLSSHLLQSLLLIVKLFWFALSFICTLSSGYYTRADNIVSTNWFKAAYIMQWLATTPIVYNLGAKVVVVVVEEEEEEVEGQVTTTTSRQYTTTSSSELTSHWRYEWDYYYSVQWQCQWFSQSISIQNIILRSFITFFMHRYCPKCGPWLSYDGSIWDGFTSSATSTLHQDQCQSYQ